MPINNRRGLRIGLVIAILVFVFAASFVLYGKSMSKGIEEYEYIVEKRLDKVEIRKYAPRYFHTVEISDSNYKSNSSKGFRILAGYIFGGNSQNRKIAMTSPVVMDMKETIKMKFMVPADEDINQLPVANDQRVQLEYVPAKRVAAIRFGGWANDKRIKKYAKELFDVLEAKGIKHLQTYSFYGYNPPFQVLDRRNEIVVDLLQ